MNTTAVRVLIVDESRFVGRLLRSQLETCPEIEVIGTATNGVEAVKLVQELRPSVVTLGVEMAGMDGLRVLDHIMHVCPTPVVLITGAGRKGAVVTQRALALGAVDFVLKYSPGARIDPAVLWQEIVTKVRLASRVKVIRALRTPAVSVKTDSVIYPVRPAPEDAPTVTTGYQKSLPREVVVIGASTGGPIALRELLGQLPSDYPASILVVQHMPATFTTVLATQLGRQLRLKIKEASNGDPLKPSEVLVAPGDHHLLLGADARVELSSAAEIGGHRPSIDATMQSAAQVFGSRTRGIVLTGMGEDGMRGLITIHGKGGTTFAQDADSCVVNGMPQRAIDQGVVDHIAPPAEIGRMLLRLGQPFGDERKW